MRSVVRGKKFFAVQDVINAEAGKQTCIGFSKAAAALAKGIFQRFVNTMIAVRRASIIKVATQYSRVGTFVKLCFEYVNVLCAVCKSAPKPL